METPPTPSAMEPAPPPVPTPMSLLGRLTNVFAAPSEVFDDVKATRSSAANWLLPTVLLIIVGIVGAILVFSQPAVRQQVREAGAQVIEKMAAKMPKERADQMREQAAMSEDRTPIAMKFGGPAFAALWSTFFWGIAIWLVGAKILKGSFTVTKGLEVAGLSTMIMVLESVVTDLMRLAMGNLYATPSLALLVKDFDPLNTTHGLLALANVMTVWILIVRGIGLSRLSNTSVMKGVSWIFGIWIAGTGILLGLSLGVRKLIGF